MTETVELLPFFEREDGSLEGFPAENYVAGLRRANGTAAVEVLLPAETVERTVLAGARLSLWLSLDGRLVLDGDGLSDEMLEAASAAGRLHEQTVVSLVTASLDPGHLAAEENPASDLTLLRQQLIEALAQVDAVLERLEQR